MPPFATEAMSLLQENLRNRNPGLSLHAAERTDIPDLRALVIADTEAALGKVVPESVTSLMVALQLDGRRPAIGPIWPDTIDGIVTCEGRAIGRLILHRSGTTIRLSELLVHPEMRGRGIGTALLQAVMATALELGRMVVARVWFDNPALKLFERAGFVDTYETDVDLVMEWRPPAAPPG